MRSPDEYDYVADEIRNDPHAWRDYALCLDATENLDEVIFPFNPAKRDEEAIQDFIETRCNQCPVSQRCLDFAVKTESIGIWGGMELNPSRVSRLRRLRNEEG